MGLINEVVQAERLLDAAVDGICQEILDKSPQSIRIAKVALNAGSDQEFYSSYFPTAELLASIYGNAENMEGITRLPREAQARLPQVPRRAAPRSERRRAMDYGLRDRTVLITGGARGIGFAAAQTVRRRGREAGARRHQRRRGRGRGRAHRCTAAAQAIGIGADITDGAQCAAMIARAQDALGPLSALVNSAAVLDDKTFLESTPADWKRMIDVCLYGAMNVLHATLAGHGRAAVRPRRVPGVRFGPPRTGAAFVLRGREGRRDRAREVGRAGGGRRRRHAERRVARRHQHRAAPGTRGRAARQHGRGKVCAPREVGAQDVPDRPHRQRPTTSPAPSSISAARPRAG